MAITSQNVVSKLAFAIAPRDDERPREVLKNELFEFREKQSALGLAAPSKRTIQSWCEHHSAPRTGSSIEFISRYLEYLLESGARDVFDPEQKKVFNQLEVFVRNVSNLQSPNQAKRDATQPDGNADKVNENIRLSVVEEHVSINAPIIRMIGADLVRQIDDYLEYLRGKNDIDPKLKAEFCEFLKKHKSNTLALARSIDGEALEGNEASTELTVSFLDRYLGHVKSSAKQYGNPEALAKITVPSGIVLLSGAVGSAFGQPLIGFGFGAWITGKMSPDKLAAKILDRSEAEDGVKNDLRDQ